MPTLRTIVNSLGLFVAVEILTACGPTSPNPPLSAATNPQPAASPDVLAEHSTSSAAALALGSGESYWPLGGYATAARDRYNGRTEHAVLNDLSIGPLLHNILFGIGAELNADASQDYGVEKLKRLEIRVPSAVSVVPAYGVTAPLSGHLCSNEGNYEFVKTSDLPASAQQQLLAPNTEPVLTEEQIAEYGRHPKTDILLSFSNCKIDPFLDVIFDGDLRIYVPNVIPPISGFLSGSNPETDADVYLGFDNLTIKTDNAEVRLTGVEKWSGPEDCLFSASKTAYVFVEDLLTKSSVLYADFQSTRDYSHEYYCWRDHSAHLPEIYSGWLYHPEFGGSSVTTVTPFAFTNLEDPGVSEPASEYRTLIAQRHGQLELTGKNATATFSYLSFPEIFDRWSDPVRAVEIALAADTAPLVLHRILYGNFQTRSVGDLIDTDQDGMTDEWETRFGFDPTTAVDASMDSDLDGLSDIDEYLYSGLPNDPSDRGMKIKSAVSIVGNASSATYFQTYGTFEVEIANGNSRFQKATQLVLFTLHEDTQWVNLDLEEKCGYHDQNLRQILCRYWSGMGDSAGSITERFSVYSDKAVDLEVSAQLIHDVGEIDASAIDAQGLIQGVNENLDYSITADASAITEKSKETEIIVSLTKSKADNGSVGIWVDVPNGVIARIYNLDESPPEASWVRCGGNSHEYAFCEVIGMRIGATLSIPFTFSAEEAGEYPIRWRIEGLKYNDNDISNDVFTSTLTVF